MKKFAKAGITVAATIGLVLGTATTAYAHSGSLDCQGRGNVTAVGVLTSAGTVISRAPEVQYSTTGRAGDSAIARSPRTSGGWSVTTSSGTANGWGNCD